MNLFWSRNGIVSVDRHRTLSEGSPPPPAGEGTVRRWNRGITRSAIAVGLGLVLGMALSARADDPYHQQRAAMLAEIKSIAEYTGGETGSSAFDSRVMAALGRVPRHLFVPASVVESAYANHPLPIGHGQTISQPYIVALMTDLMHLTPDSRALEIGTGSAYQAAVMGELAGKVYTIEIIEPLAVAAKQRLRDLGYDNIKTRFADGYYGWPEFAPFDAIMVTAAASHVPLPLIAQLAPGGVLVIPVGGRFAVQQLVLITKQADGTLRTRQVLPVRFVPLTGGH